MPRRELQDNSEQTGEHLRLQGNSQPHSRWEANIPFILKKGGFQILLQRKKRHSFAGLAPRAEGFEAQRVLKGSGMLTSHVLTGEALAMAIPGSPAPPAVVQPSDTHHGDAGGSCCCTLTAHQGKILQEGSLPPLRSCWSQFPQILGKLGKRGAQEKGGGGLPRRAAPWGTKPAHTIPIPASTHPCRNH